MNSDMIWQILRYGLIAAGGFLTQRGVITADNLTATVGALGTLFTVGWGIYVKKGTQAVPDAVANKPSIPTVSGATGKVVSGPGATE